MPIKRLHIELSTRCQASCPMCPRNHAGGAVRGFVGLDDISFKQFEKWFTPGFLSQLEFFLACGNYGDPVMNNDVLQILGYLRSHNQQCKISFHTNGSARNTDWWQGLASIIGSQGQVVLAIDGFASTHSIYRIGTNWDHVMKTADALIAAGIDVWAETLVFDHNKDEIDGLKDHLYQRGFKHVNIKYTNRFAGSVEFPVVNGTVLQSANITAKKPMPTDTEFERWLATAVIDPKCQQYGGEIYVDVAGRVWPCCWVSDTYTRIKDPDRGDFSWASWSSLQGQEIKYLVETLPPIYLDDAGIDAALLAYNEHLLLWQKAWMATRKPCECVIHCKKLH